LQLIYTADFVLDQSGVMMFKIQMYR